MKKGISLIMAVTLLLCATGCRRISGLDGWLDKYLRKDEAYSQLSEVSSEYNNIVSETESELTFLEDLESEIVSSVEELPSQTQNSSSQSSAPSQPSPSTPAPPTSPQISDLLNSAALNSQKTNATKLDSLIDSIFAQIHTGGMSTYDKVKACYDYLVNNCSYSSLGFAILDTSVTSDLIYKSNYDQRIVVNAYLILSTNQGVCDNYSAAFVVMCRRIGLDAHVIGGTVSKKGGGRTGHAWAYINISGTQYIFDPQVQNNNKNAPYHYFGKTYAQMGTTYEPSLSVYNAAEFANFECYQKPAYDIGATLDIIGGENTVSTTARQQGMSLTSGISGIMGGGVVTDANGCVKLNLSPSGGSGKYIVALTVTDDLDTEGTVIFEKTITGAQTIEINYNEYSNRSNPRFNVVILDNVNTDSYLIFKGIILKLP